MEDRLSKMIQMQRELQLRMPPPNQVPGALRGDERANFVTWNMFAMEDELHEAIAEMGWKPWATSRHLNAPAMMKEMVDAWHFFMNVMLVIGGELGITNDDDLAEYFYELYHNKNQVNSERQKEGYDGLSSKCPQCHRETTETNSLFHFDLLGKTFCSETCAEQYSGATG